MNAESKYIGRFPSEEEATRAWDTLALKFRSSKAKLNFYPRTGEELRGFKRICDFEHGRLGYEHRRRKRLPRHARRRAPATSS